MPSTDRHTDEATLGRVLTAALTLRFAGRRLGGRVYWPREDAADGGSPLVFVPAPGGGSDSESLCHLMCSAACAVVLAITSTQPLGVEEEIAALGWAAEHAPQLGAHPERLIVAGQGGAGEDAARLALRARDNGWPQLRRQVVLYPSFSQTCPMPSLLTGVAPATVISSDTRIDDGSRYAALLRASNVEVDELRYSPPVLPGHDDLSAAFSGRAG